MKSKIIMFMMVVSLLLLSTFVTATGVTTRYNPFTQRLDYVSDGNFNGTNITGDDATFTSLNVTSGAGIGDYAGFATGTLHAFDESVSWSSIYHTITDPSEWFSFYVTNANDGCFQMNSHTSPFNSPFTVCADGDMFLAPESGVIKFGDSNLTEVQDIEATGMIRTTGALNVTTSAGIGNYLGFTTNALFAFDNGLSWANVFHSTTDPSEWFTFYVNNADDGAFQFYTHANAGQAAMSIVANGPVIFNPQDGIVSFSDADINDLESIVFTGSTAAILSPGNNLKLTAADNVNIDVNLTLGDESNLLLFESGVNGTHAVIESFQGLDIYISPDGNNVRLPTLTNVTWDNGASISVNTTCIILSSPAGTGVYNLCD